MKKLLLLVLLVWTAALSAQTRLEFQPVFAGKTISLNQPFRTPEGDSLNMAVLRFYLTDFKFYKNGKLVFQEKNSYHLLDLENPASMGISFQLPARQAFDAVSFKLGTDSLTNVSGAQGGDLDPTNGMFWTWQSGYVNVKIEGSWTVSSLRDDAFQYHLGGYTAPYPTVQTVKLKVPKKAKTTIQLDFAPVFQEARRSRKFAVMSPGLQAAHLAVVLGKSFQVYAP